jgi:hypothetical protein
VTLFVRYQIVQESEQWGPTWYTVLDKKRDKRIARCPEHADAANICTALNLREALDNFVENDAYQLNLTIREYMKGK